jgi:hypothetical protein
MYKLHASGSRARPVIRHQEQIALTAKFAVSWSTPALTQPLLPVMLETPYGTAPPSLGLENPHPNGFRLSHRPQLATSPLGPFDLVRGALYAGQN